MRLLTILLLCSCEASVGSEMDALTSMTHRLVIKPRADVSPMLGAHGLTPRRLVRLNDAVLDQLYEASANNSDLRSYLVVDGTHERLSAVLADLSAVADVWLTPLFIVPPGDMDPPTPLFVDQQQYRLPAPNGIDANYADSIGARGEGVRLLDVEIGWHFAHEDLVDKALHREAGQTPDPSGDAWWYHGTAAIGMIAAVKNNYGMTGIAPDADFYTFSEWTTEGGSRRVEAIAAAVAAARAGDVLMLEMQLPWKSDKDYGPAELEPAVWDIVKTATDSGVIVVAAAGNGGLDLDASEFAEYRARGDSGAILVGASSVWNSRASLSTYGTRVNLRGSGGMAATLGGGDLFRGPDDPNQDYMAGFTGTSAATPVVAGACVIAQAYAKRVLGRTLSPREMRDLLVETGSPQTYPEKGLIGPLPNLRAALEKLSAGAPAGGSESMNGLVITDVVAAPETDMSGDGIFSASGDELVRIENTATLAADLGGATLSDAVGVRVTMPAGTVLPPGAALVVFGGGAIGVAAESTMQISLGTLALNDSGDEVTLAKAGTTLASFRYGKLAQSPK